MPKVKAPTERDHVREAARRIMDFEADKAVSTDAIKAAYADAAAKGVDKAALRDALALKKKRDRKAKAINDRSDQYFLWLTEDFGSTDLGAAAEDREKTVVRTPNREAEDAVLVGPPLRSLPAPPLRPHNGLDDTGTGPH